MTMTAGRYSLVPLAGEVRSRKQGAKAARERNEGGDTAGRRLSLKPGKTRCARRGCTRKSDTLGALWCAVHGQAEVLR